MLLEPTMLQASKKITGSKRNLALEKALRCAGSTFVFAGEMKKNKALMGETNTLTKRTSTNIELEANWPMVHC